MKKKIFGGLAILAIAAVAVFNVNFNSKSSKLSDVSLANVEALAEYEIPSSDLYCDLSCYTGGKCWTMNSPWSGYTSGCTRTGNPADWCLC